MDPDKTTKNTWRSLKRYFLTGSIVLTPVGITLFLLYKAFIFLDGILGNLIHYFLGEILSISFFEGNRIPGLGFIALILLLTVAGFATRNVFGQWLLAQAPRFMRQVPLVNRIYRAIDQISRAIFSGHQEVFKKAVLIEYPRKGIYSIAIMTADTGGTLQENLPEDSISVFLPTTPNPTSGFLLFVPKNQVIELDIPVEDALKLIISGGTLNYLDSNLQQLT